MYATKVVQFSVLNLGSMVLTKKKKKNLKNLGSMAWMGLPNQISQQLLTNSAESLNEQKKMSNDALSILVLVLN